MRLSPRFTPRLVRLVLAALAVGLALGGADSAHAGAVPTTLPVHGYLLGSDGQPVDGPHGVTLRLFGETEGGSPLHAEEFPGLAVELGRFVAPLGEGTRVAGDPLDAAFFAAHPALYLEVVIDGSEVIQPRFLLGAVPYAAVAEQATRAASAATADSATNAANAANANRAKAADSATRATAADTATHATSADSATHASTCDDATSAESASLAADASKLGGFTAADYLRSATGALQEASGAVSVRDGGITGAMLARPLAYTGDATFTDDAALAGAALAVKSGANTLSLGGSSLECSADMTVNATGKKRVTFGGPVTVTGDATVTGALRVGHEIRRCTSATTCGCSSTAHVVLGGGVKDSNAVYESYPSSYLGVPGWVGKCGTDGICSEMWVICARLAP